MGERIGICRGGPWSGEEFLWEGVVPRHEFAANDQERWFHRYEVTEEVDDSYRRVFRYVESWRVTGPLTTGGQGIETRRFE